MLYITVYEAFRKWCTPVQLWGGCLWGCGDAQVPLNLHQDDDIYIHHNWCTQHNLPRANIFTGSSLSSEVLRPNIPYAK